MTANLAMMSLRLTPPSSTTSSEPSIFCCPSSWWSNKRGRSHFCICATHIPCSTARPPMSVAFVLGLSLLLHPGIDSQAHAFPFDWLQTSPSIEKDPVEPFTLYGSIFKKYFLENIVDGKVVSRKKGFTSTACVNALNASKETPELQGIPAGLKVVIIGDPLCSKSEGQTREGTCLPSCRSACTRAISNHLEEVIKETGYVLDPRDTEKVTVACSNQCTNECLKPGKTSSFIYPFRPSK